MLRNVFCVSLLTLVAAASASAGRTVEVSSVGSPTLSGRRLLRTLARIPAPSATNTWLLKIEPGIYDLGDQALVMRPFVDIKGSGQGVTTVTSSGINTLIAASNTEIRKLTLGNTNPNLQGTPGCDPGCYTVLVDDGADATLTDVAIDSAGRAFGLLVRNGATADVTGGSVTCADFCFGVWVWDGSAATLNGASITTPAFLSESIKSEGTVNLINATVDAGAGASAIVSGVASTSVTNVHHSILRGKVTQVFLGKVKIGASQVVLPVPTFATCVASYDESFNPLGVNCQPIP